VTSSLFQRASGKVSSCTSRRFVWFVPGFVMGPRHPRGYRTDDTTVCCGSQERSTYRKLQAQYEVGPSITTVGAESVGAAGPLVAS
jgi:hypothetical protein